VQLVLFPVCVFSLPFWSVKRLVGLLVLYLLLVPRRLLVQAYLGMLPFCLFLLLVLAKPLRLVALT